MARGKRGAGEVDGQRCCSGCSRTLPVDRFYRRPEGHVTGRCRDCVSAYGKANRWPSERRRDRTFRDRYGITLAQRDAMIEAQGGRCAICDEKHERLCVDHDHETGAVRAILCNRCNVAVGVLESARLPDLVAYLAAHGGEVVLH